MADSKYFTDGWKVYSDYIHIFKFVVGRVPSLNVTSGPAPLYVFVTYRVCTLEFFTNTLGWQNWHYCNFVFPRYLHCSSLFISTDFSQCEIRYEGVNEDYILRLNATLD